MQTCLECGATWYKANTCQDYFYQMLAWENENPDYGEVHHLLVLCYHLQHPSLYSPEGLNAAKRLLVDFGERGITPAEARRRHHSQVDSNRRTWKIKGTPASHGAYDSPVQWSMTAADVIENGEDHYRESVRTWARSILEALKDSGNLAPEYQRE